MDLRAGMKKVRVLNPDGAHNIAVGVDAPVEIEVDGHAGYYAAGMNKQASVLIRGNAGPGLAEGMESGVRACERFRLGFGRCRRHTAACW